MSWYPETTTTTGHQPPSLPPQSQFQPQQQQGAPPPTQVSYNNQQWHNPPQQQQQQPHQQSAAALNYQQQQPGNFAPQQLQHQQQQVAPSWNTTNNASAYFKQQQQPTQPPPPQTDMNQNFAATIGGQPTPAMAGQPNDGWGDWGDEWAGENASAATNNNSNATQDAYNTHQQLPPPPPMGHQQNNQQSFNDQYYSNNQSAHYATPANYPAPPPVAYDSNMNQPQQENHNQNVIADSFSASSDSWNWNATAGGGGAAAAVDSNANPVELIRKPAVFNKMSQSAIEKIVTTNPVEDSFNTNQPDDMKSQNYGVAHPPTSLGAVRLPNATVLDQSQQEYNQQTFAAPATDDLDPLDVALMQMQNNQSGAPLDTGASFFGPPSSGGISLPNSTVSSAPPSDFGGVENREVVEDIPPVAVTAPASGHPMENIPKESMPPPFNPAPPLMATQPPLPSASPAGELPPPQAAGGNPFKRSGAPVHRNLSFNAAPASAVQPTTTTTSMLPPPPSITPNPPPPIPAPVPNNNDRNEYLQTDQLSEEVTVSNAHSREANHSETVDNLPPPGLSRLVLGETEDHHHSSGNVQAPLPPVSQQQLSSVAPPLGLNRMVPGTDLEGSVTGMSLHREADGQDDDGTNFTQNQNYPPADLTDRNLYRVPGESHQDQQQVTTNSQSASRVVTGDENAMPFVQPAPVDLTSAAGHSVLLGEEADEPRNLRPVDGENSCDDDNVRFNRQHGEILSREEPIEGENAGDDVIISSGGAAAATATEVVADISSMAGEGGSVPSTVTNVMPNPRKETSTGEDSDKEHSSYYKSKSGRGRNDVDTGSLRRKAKYQERYDSESENSERRGPRNQGDRSYAPEKHRVEERDGRRRRGADESRHNRSERDRDRRHGDRREEDYDRSGYGRGEERRSKRYYEEERDGQPRRRTAEGDAKKADKERQYRKDRDRDRDDRKEYKDDRDRRYNREKDRRYDYDDERYNRSGSRNTDRSRDPRYANSGYYGQNYGYDHYAYYTQQQQQQMQYYENLRRTNPQAYAEWYRKYYMQASGMAGVAGAAVAGGMMQPEMPTDGRESVHSGRSSTNDKERYNRMSMSTGYYHQQSHGQYADYQRGMDTSLMDSTYGGPSSLMSSYSYGNYQQPQSMMMSRSQVYTPSGALQQHLQQPSFYSQSDFSDARHGQQQEKDANRMTPFKYTNEHGQVSISNGLLVCVKPKYSQNGVINLVKIINIGSMVNEFDADKRLLAVYPGPLVRGVTHKKTVIEFCEERLKLGPFVPASAAAAMHTRENSLLRSHANSMTSLCSVTQNSGQQSSQQQHQQFKASYNLLWNLLILLLRQNGTVVGTDIAELLIKNVTEFPATNSNLVVIEATIKPVKEKPDRAADGGDASLSDINSDESNEEMNQQGTSSIATKASSLSEEQITEKFRNHLLYGNVTEALDWATENNLWGHALFLASKMDRRSHLNVMMKFANKLALNDPLQTLYQLMSLRMPSFVTSVVDKKWGDWRPHLAMILSNTSQKPDLDRKAITTLGDSLFHIGDVYGSHFCYLMAQVGFGKYEPWTPESVASATAPKLVLLGSSPARPFKEFATSEAIIMTEIYEYAVTLNDESYMIAEYQPYKFTLATRLLDYGHQLKAFLHMERLAKNIQRDPQRFEWSLVNNVCMFADRLRYYDPVQERTVDNNDSQDSDGDHQKWIQDLKEMAGQFQLNPPQSYQNGDQQQQTEPRGSIDRQFAEINQQFNQLNLQYQNYETQPQTDYYGEPDSQQQAQQGQVDSQPSQYLQPDFSQRETVTDSVQSDAQASPEANQYDPYGYQQQQQHQSQDQQSAVGNFYNPAAYENNGGGGFSPGDQQAQDPTSGYGYYGQQQQQQQMTSEHKKGTSANKTGTPRRQVHPRDTSPETEVLSNSHKLTHHNGGSRFEKELNSFDFGLRSNKGKAEGTMLPPPPPPMSKWPAKIEEPDERRESDYDAPRPQISMPSSMSNRPGFYDEDGGEKRSGGGGQPQQQSKAADKQSGKGDKDKGQTLGKANEQSSGWFGGIWGKLSLKPKNQMILPDDKNPSIVWDPDKKRWINTDGDAAEEEAFKPPPKMSELNLPQQPMGQPMMMQHQQQQQQPSMSMPPTFAGTPAPVPMAMAPTPMMNVNAVTPPAEDPSAVDGANRVPTNNLQSNQFKLQRNRTLKKSYVDVFNPSGAPMKPVDNLMAPSTVPTIPQSGFFIPGAAPMGQQPNFN